MATRKKSPVADIVELKRLIKNAALLVDGGSDLYNTKDPVTVALVFDVTSFGPHQAAIFADQSSSPDLAIQGAYEFLEVWKIKNYREHVLEIQEEYGDEWRDILTETFDGRWFTMSFRDFARAIRGTKAEKYIDLDVE